MYTFAAADAIPDFAHLQATIALECIHFAPRRILARAHEYFAHLKHSPARTGLMRAESTSCSSIAEPERPKNTPFPDQKEPNHELKTPKRKRFLRIVLDSEDEEDGEDEVESDGAGSVKPLPPRYPDRYVVLDDREWEVYEVRSEDEALGIAKNPAIDLGKGVRLYVKEFFNQLLNTSIDRDRARDQAKALAEFSEENPIDADWHAIKERGNARSRKKAGIPGDVPDGTPLYYWVYKAVEGLLERE